MALLKFFFLEFLNNALKDYNLKLFEIICTIWGVFGGEPNLCFDIILPMSYVWGEKKIV